MAVFPAQYIRSRIVRVQWHFPSYIPSDLRPSAYVGMDDRRLWRGRRDTCDDLSEPSGAKSISSERSSCCDGHKLCAVLVSACRGQDSEKKGT